MKFFKAFLLVFLLFLNLGSTTSFAAPGDSSLPSKQVSEDWAQWVTLSEITISEIDLLLAELGTSETVLRNQVIHLIKSVDDKIDILSQLPALTRYQKVIKTLKKHHFESRLSYKLPRFVGFDCSECGFGHQESWAFRYAENCKPTHCSRCEFLSGHSLWCAGLQCYAYQWALAPLVGWDCTGVECKTELPARDVARWAQSLKQGLVRLNARLKDLMELETGAESPRTFRIDEDEMMPTAPEGSVAGTADPASTEARR